MQTIRSFIGIPLTDEVLRATKKLIDRLSQSDDGIKWVPTDSLHLTLKFLGDVDNVEVPKICDVIGDAVEDLEPFEIRLAGVGGFPSLDRPRVIYAGIQDDQGGLAQIAGHLEDGLADLGYKREPRDYHPHLTLGRIKGSRAKGSQAVIEQARSHAEFGLGSMVIDEVRLVASFLDKHGPTYQVMNTVQF